MTPSLKARIIAEWRGLPEEPFPKDTAELAGKAVGQILSKLGLQARVKEEEIKAAWKEVVGDFLALHSSPAGLSNGVLTVHVLQPTVHFELERVWKKPLLQKLQARFGKPLLREIRFRLG
ncbi:MAG: DUF721 domain-containing protein [Verrucomicrobiota bacterium]